jgi:undecaprenyl-diphosphatase
MPDWLIVVILGVIEGITEFLPISSTGHLLMAGHWLKEQSDLFYVFIQSGAVVAVIPLFSDRCRKLVFGWKQPANRQYGLKLTAAFGLTGAGGLLLEQNNFELPETVQPIAWALIVGGILFLIVESWVAKRPRLEEITWTVAIMVGLGQLIAAVFPGASRSGTTILLALMLGTTRSAATEFSFLVGIPTMLAAGSLKLTKVVLRPPPDQAPESWGLLALGTVVSAVVSFIVVKWLLRFIQSHTFKGFGWYRIVLGLLMLVLASRIDFG